MFLSFPDRYNAKTGQTQGHIIILEDMLQVKI